MNGTMVWRVIFTKFPRVYSLIWTIRGYAAGQGTGFGLFDLNRVYNFAQAFPKKGICFDFFKKLVCSPTIQKQWL